MIVKNNQRALYKSCYKKNKYNTNDEANLEGIKQMKVRGANQLYYYLCNNCNKWHLTHDSKVYNNNKYRVV